MSDALDAARLRKLLAEARRAEHEAAELERTTIFLADAARIEADLFAGLAAFIARLPALWAPQLRDCADRAAVDARLRDLLSDAMTEMIEEVGCA